MVSSKVDDSINPYEVYHLFRMAIIVDNPYHNDNISYSSMYASTRFNAKVNPEKVLIENANSEVLTYAYDGDNHHHPMDNDATS